MPTQTKRRIAVIGGDGIGPEVTQEAIKVLNASCGEDAFAFESLPYCADYTLETGITIPKGELARIEKNYDALLMGALGDPRIPDMRHAVDILLGARRQLDLFINLRPVHLIHEQLCPLKGLKKGDINLVIFRENTEGAYGGLGGSLGTGTKHEVALTEMIATYRGTERIIRAAFEYARKHGLKKLHMASKYNAIPHAHGLWTRIFDEIRTDYPEIDAKSLFADVVAMELIRDPSQFDVIVTSNMLGDILSDLAAQIVGGIGLAPSANINPDRFSLFEPVHGSAPDLAGKGIANPLAAILTAAMLAREMDYVDNAARIESAVVSVVEAGQTTPDLQGQLSTSAVGDAVCQRL
jgi:3-isopropylmalate dehydrogenase